MPEPKLPRCVARCADRGRAIDAGDRLDARGEALRLSQLPAASVADLLANMQLVEAIRSSRGHGVVATRLPARMDNDYYSGADYRIELEDQP